MGIDMEKDAKKKFVLIGFMGCGKTTVGRLLAEREKLRFMDTDQQIEAEEGRTVSEIFASDGEERFRELETALLARLAGEAAGGCVYAVGGGTPLREENRALLRKMGEVIWLSVQPDTVLKRLSHDRSRPLLQGADREQRVRELLKKREDCYRAAADRVIPVDGADSGGIAAIIAGDAARTGRSGAEEK
ncbi:shikimate kinase [Lachnoclostridium sp. Marseille-P6806]|uniref:shikimate kinase n=1 Tax=Lachnoclostridium sp. Marseille-P6806 TaxID=2364793 RepID=UPI001F5E3D65|nr:shikimate kinase [Lachnoclostridium sp. Marseille-P6806]